MSEDSVFGHPTGTCDWCGTPGQELFEYSGKDVCASCRQILIDYDNVGAIEDAYQQIHKLIQHADTNYPYP